MLVAPATERSGHDGEVVDARRWSPAVRPGWVRRSDEVEGLCGRSGGPALASPRAPEPSAGGAARRGVGGRRSLRRVQCVPGGPRRPLVPEVAGAAVWCGPRLPRAVAGPVGEVLLRSCD